MGTAATALRTLLRTASARQAAKRLNYNVRQKSWNRSSPFLITSMLVA